MCNGEIAKRETFGTVSSIFAFGTDAVACVAFVFSALLLSFVYIFTDGPSAGYSALSITARPLVPEDDPSEAHCNSDLLGGLKCHGPSGHVVTDFHSLLRQHCFQTGRQLYRTYGEYTAVYRLFGHHVRCVCIPVSFFAISWSLKDRQVESSCWRVHVTWYHQTHALHMC